MTETQIVGSLLALLVVVLYVPYYLPKEAKARLKNFKFMFGLCIVSLMYDSKVFAYVLYNCVSKERDSLVTSVTLKDGRHFNIYGHEIIQDKTNDKAVS